MPMSGSLSADKGLRLESLYNVRVPRLMVARSTTRIGAVQKKQQLASPSTGGGFVIVMATLVIINRLQWKAYLIFMCTTSSMDKTNNVASAVE